MIDLSLSDEQRQIADGAQNLLQEHAPLARLRDGAADADLHTALAAWGWFGTGLKVADGGLGLGPAEDTLLYLAAGRFLLPPSVLATSLAARISSGERRTALLSGNRKAAAAVRGNGDAAFCLDRASAADLLVFGGERIWLAPADRFVGEPVAGFDETIFTETGKLEPDASWPQGPVDHALLLVAAMLAGIAAASSELAAEYAKHRQQFGQAIGAFQAIKHLCAELAVRAYAAEAQVKIAAAYASDDPASAPFQIRAAIVNALAAARFNAATAIQIHGGIGFTAECAVHHYVKRTHVLGALVGGIGHQQAALLALPSPVSP
jgi:alkylation response protein AidB-like acyl-CoA dehydrogenase